MINNNINNKCNLNLSIQKHINNNSAPKMLYNNNVNSFNIQLLFNNINTINNK